jgi:hypothetical protein
MRMLDLVPRLLVLLAAAAQIIVPFYVNPFRDGAQPIRGAVPSQLEPAGYAFTIWTPIYLAALAYAVWQLTPAGRRDRDTARIAPLAVLLYAGSSAWLVVARDGPLWATMPILGAMALCATIALVLTVGGRPSLLRVPCLEVPFGLYAGWTVCATFVNVAEVAPLYGFRRLGLSVAGFAEVAVGVLAILAVCILWVIRGNLAFAAAVIWALVAILVADLRLGAPGPVIAATAMAVVTVVAAVLAARARRPTFTRWGAG